MTSSTPHPDRKRLVEKLIPWLLLSVRVVMTPLMLLPPRWLRDRAMLWLYAVAFVTDYLDGAVARRLGTATPLLRKADSTADTFFHLAVAIAILGRHPAEVRNNVAAVILYASTVTIWCVMDALRWRRVAGFHMLSSKVFSLSLLVWMVTLLSGWHTGHLLSIALTVGTLSNLEGIAISLLLRQDRTDVFTVNRAIRLRRTQPVQHAGNPATGM